jgi:hypothetical protein
MKTKLGGLALVLVATTALMGSMGVRPLVNIAHITHDGQYIQEIRLHVMKDSKVYLEEVNYTRGEHLVCKESIGKLTEVGFQRLKALVDAGPLQQSRTSQEFVNIDEHADVWYVAVHNTRTEFFVFKEPDWPPPVDFVSWFEGSRHIQPLEGISLGQNNHQCSAFSKQMAETWKK